MRYSSVATALLFAALSAADAHAQEYPRYGQMVAVGGFIGSLDLSSLYQFSNGTTWNADTGPGQGVQIAFGVTPVVSVIGGYYAATTGFFAFNREPDPMSFDTDGSFEAKFADVGLQFRRPIHHLAAFSPFAQIGVGTLTMTRDMGSTVEQDVGNAWNAAVGLDLQFGNLFALRAMVKDYMPMIQWQGSEVPTNTASSVPTRSHNMAWMVGITLGR